MSYPLKEARTRSLFAAIFTAVGIAGSSAACRIAAALLLFILALVLMPGERPSSRRILILLSAAVVLSTSWPIIPLPVLGLVPSVTYFLSERYTGRSASLGVIIACSITLIVSTTFMILLWWTHRGWIFTDLTPHWLSANKLAVAGFVILTAGVNSVFEESIWRGYFFDELGGDRRPGLAAVLSSLLFGISHWRGLPSGGSGVVLTLIFGLAMCALRVISGGSLRATCVCHWVADVFVIGLAAGLLAV